MQDITKQLEIARAELAAIEATNKEAAIAAAFKRTSDVRVVIALKLARENVATLSGAFEEQKEVEKEAFNVLRATDLSSPNRREVFEKYHIAFLKAQALDKRLEDAKGAVESILADYAPVVKDTAALEVKILSLRNALPKAEPEEEVPLRQWRLARAEKALIDGEARISLVRSRMAAGEAVIPGEAREWLPVDEDEATETVAWLNAKHDSARLPRRKGHRRNSMTVLDFALLDAGNDWPGAKRGRYWGRDTDNYWRMGYEARVHAAEAAAWER